MVTKSELLSLGCGRAYSIVQSGLYAVALSEFLNAAITFLSHKEYYYQKGMFNLLEVVRQAFIRIGLCDGLALIMSSPEQKPSWKTEDEVKYKS
ncbi:MAG: hypothetical protein V9F46_15135 [Chitinophagaceae bacterium]